MTQAIQAQANGSAQGDYLAEIARLKAENEALRAKAAAKATLSCKVGAAGGVSVYGMGRYPVTLYRSQWEALAKFMPTVMEFIADHASELKTKGAE